MNILKKNNFENLQMKNVDAKDMKVRIKFAIVQWKLDRLKQLRVDALVRKAVFKFRMLLKVKITRLSPTLEIQKEYNQTEVCSK